jgi:hypothetical protein
LQRLLPCWKLKMSVAVNIEDRADETELFRANEDLRTVGARTTATPVVAHPAVAMTKGLRECSELVDRSYAVAFGGGRVALVRDRATEWWQGW